MYVCVCNAVTESQVREAAAEGARTLTDLTFRTGCAGTCGSCAPHAESVLKQARADCGAHGLPLIEA